jgi:hypothetical protein
MAFVLRRCRELYNAALQERREAWHTCHTSITCAHQSAQLPAIKAVRPEYQDVLIWSGCSKQLHSESVSPLEGMKKAADDDPSHRAHGDDGQKFQTGADCTLAGIARLQRAQGQGHDRCQAKGP